MGRGVPDAKKPKLTCNSREEGARLDVLHDVRINRRNYTRLALAECYYSRERRSLAIVSKQFSMTAVMRSVNIKLMVRLMAL